MPVGRPSPIPIARSTIETSPRFEARWRRVPTIFSGRVALLVSPLHVVDAQESPQLRIVDRRGQRLVQHPHHLLGRDAVGGHAGDEGAGAGPHVDVEVVHRGVDREQVEGPQRADLVDAAGEPAAAEDERRLVGSVAGAPPHARGSRPPPAHPRSVRPSPCLRRLCQPEGRRIHRYPGAPPLFWVSDVPDRAPRSLERACAPLLIAVAFLVAVAPASAGATAPDVPGVTPIVKGGPKADAAVSAANLKGGLARQLRRSGGKGGAWVGDPVTGRTLFSSGASKPFQIASNMKVFTTAAALAALGPNERFETRLIADGELEGGVLAGDLILVGGGDPSLTAQGIGRLADRARAAGLDRVKGRLLYDESLFDRKRTVRQRGISGGPFVDLGRLSGLAYDGGRATDPARSAAATMVSALRRRGVQVGSKTAPGEAADQARAGRRRRRGHLLVAGVPLALHQHLLDQLLRRDDPQGPRGRRARPRHDPRRRLTGHGLRPRGGRFASHAERVRPEPRRRRLPALGRQPCSRACSPSPPPSGTRSSTPLRSPAGPGRWRGGCAGRPPRATASARRGRSRASAPSRATARSRPGRFVVFSILMQRVDIGRAHVAQDRMTSLIARYDP